MANFDGIKVGDTLYFKEDAGYIGKDGTNTVVVSSVNYGSNGGVQNITTTTIYNPVGSYRKDSWYFSGGGLEELFDTFTREGEPKVDKAIVGTFPSPKHVYHGEDVLSFYNFRDAGTVRIELDHEGYNSKMVEIMLTKTELQDLVTDLMGRIVWLDDN